jgi:hypothetical protein
VNRTLQEELIFNEKTNSNQKIWQLFAKNKEEVAL